MEGYYVLNSVCCRMLTQLSVYMARIPSAVYVLLYRIYQIAANYYVPPPPWQRHSSRQPTTIETANNAESRKMIFLKLLFKYTATAYLRYGNYT